MSTKTPARLEDSGTDDSSTDAETTAPHPLGEEIADVAPYANDHVEGSR